MQSIRLSLQPSHQLENYLSEGIVYLPSYPSPSTTSRQTHLHHTLTSRDSSFKDPPLCQLSRFPPPPAASSATSKKSANPRSQPPSTPPRSTQTSTNGTA